MGRGPAIACNEQDAVRAKMPVGMSRLLGGSFFGWFQRGFKGKPAPMGGEFQTQDFTQQSVGDAAQS